MYVYYLSCWDSTISDNKSGLFSTIIANNRFKDSFCCRQSVSTVCKAFKISPRLASLSVSVKDSETSSVNNYSWIWLHRHVIYHSSPLLITSSLAVMYFLRLWISLIGSFSCVIVWHLFFKISTSFSLSCNCFRIEDKVFSSSLNL